MPPAVARESYAAAFSNIRGLLAAAKETQDAKEVLRKAFQAIEASTEVSENLVRSLAAVEDKVEQWESLPSLAAQFAQGQKPLSESKCVSNLKTLGSDKADFKAWNDKLINALAQTLGAPWRKFMKKT